MSDLLVEISALTTAAGHIRSASAVAAEVHGKGIVLEAQSHAAGDAEASGALAHFFDQWGYGAGHLHTDADELAKALGVVVEAFTQVDKTMGDALKNAPKAPK